MLSPREAAKTILERVTPITAQELVPIRRAAGRVLARAVVSDVDLPPFEKSAMDGYAVHSGDLAGTGERALPILGESRAGAPYAGEVPRGACVAIYTGAEVPAGCDAVVMVELSQELPPEAPGGPQRVLLRDTPRERQHICARGQDVAAGRTVLEPGRRLRPVDLGLLASVGCEPVPVVRRPRVAVLTTGDELVRPEERPGPGQIREGNTLHLAAMSEAAGAEVVRCGLLRDDPGELERELGAALEACDLLVTTGGVSMGRYDLVGEALLRLGVEPVFHKVAIKPGKPLWFGVRGSVPVLALPGNPVSCLVNHVVFVEPALRRLGGELDPEPRLRRGRWAGAALATNPRDQYLPVRLRIRDDGGEDLEPVRWNGSADLIGIGKAQALALLPAGTTVAAGESLAFVEL